MKAQYSAIYWALITVLVGCSLFFTYRVVTFKTGLTAGSRGLSIESGTAATFVKAIDGDEIAVQVGEDNFIVRILGIKAFDPAVNDPQLAGLAAQSVAFINRQLAGRTPTLTFTEFKTDRRKRVLAHVEIDDLDVGRQMVAEGLALVYTLYPFGRMSQYLEVETQARAAGTGLWGNPVAVERSELLKILWEQERSDV
jgi:micrococcal nuclease